MNSLNPVAEDETVNDGTWDFCILVLDDKRAEEKLEKEMGLAWLECATGDDLDYKDDVVSIFGHPQVGKAPKRPLRMSYGREENPDSEDKPDSLYFEYDALEGDSGSPVVGRGSEKGTSYAVKGIHTGSEGKRFKKNRAQGLKRLSDWISLDPIPTSLND